MQRKCLLFILALSLLTQLAAQQKKTFALKRFNVQTINFEQGLLNNGVKDIVTDTFGFSWISTELGIQRYNGNTLENIMPVVNKQPVKINSASLFIKLKNGMLWISHQHGILEYDPFTDSYRNIILDAAYHGTLLFFPVKESDDGVWFLRKNKLVDISRTGKTQTEILFAPPSFTESIFFHGAALTSNSHFVFIKKNEDLIAEINTQTHEAIDLDLKESNIESLDCNDSKLYAVSPNSLTSFNINTGKIEQKINLKNYFDDTKPFAQIKFTGKNVLLLSISNRLMELDTLCVLKKEYTALNSGPLVNAGYIYKIYADAFSRLWLITNDDIKKIQNTEMPFQNFLYADAKNNFVRCMYYDEQKKILLAGCYNGGLQLYDTLGNALWAQPLITEKIKDILNIEKLAANTYLIITFNAGWFTLSLPSKELKPLALLPDAEKYFKPNELSFTSNLQRINDSTIFIASTSNIYQCVFKNGALKNIQPIFSFHTKAINNFSSCIIASDGTIWAGTADGSLYRKNKDQQFLPVILPDNFTVRCFAEDSKHNIWVGTEKGLYVFTASGILIQKISAETGLRNDCIYSLVPDNGTGSVFAGTNLGLSQIISGKTIKNYTKQNGLQDNEFNTESIAKTSEGRIFFGGVKGITAFYPSTLNTTDDKPSLLIYKVDVNSDEYRSDSAIWASGKLQLNYSQNKIAFSVSAAGMQNASDYQYEYKMEGYDKYWSVTNMPVNIHYNLSSGNYRFVVRLTGSATEKSQIISIAYPFWRKWWFYVLSVLFIFALVFLIARFFYRKKYYSKLRTLEMQQQLYHERERISRDLHDNLGAYTSAITTQVDDIVQQYKSYNNPSVVQLKNSAREIMFQLRDTIWALNQENISITMLSDRIKNYFHKISPSYAAVQFDVEEKIEEEKYLSSVNGLHIFRIIQEAIHNAIKHSGCSVIKVSIFSAKTILLSIEDNGKGLSSEIVSQGNGLDNMKERAKEINWELIFNNKEDSGFCITLKGNA
jgi:ligand-binding sensor domain-containing protein